MNQTSKVYILSPWHEQKTIHAYITAPRQASLLIHHEALSHNVIHIFHDCYPSYNVYTIGRVVNLDVIVIFDLEPECIYLNYNYL